MVIQLHYFCVNVELHSQSPFFSKLKLKVCKEGRQLNIYSNVERKLSRMFTAVQHYLSRAGLGWAERTSLI